MRRPLIVSSFGVVVVLGLFACGSSDTHSDGATAGSAGSAATAGAPAGGSNAAGSSGGPAVAGSQAAAGSPAGGAGGSSAGSDSGGTGGATAAGGSSAGAAAGGAASKTTFFVTSDTSMTGKLGGLTGADARCQALAVAAGFGGHTFHAYLSAEHDAADANKAVNARDRIGTGPWYNSLGVLLAQDLTTLHALSGNPDLFVDEKGKKINGHWVGTPTPVEHDVLTGSTADGKVLAGKTCSDWTSAGNTTAQVGHSDGLGPPNANNTPNSAPPYNSWNSSHENGSCADTAPKGGKGRLYCFAIN